MLEQEFETTEKWNLRYFSELGFGPNEAMLLLAWRIDPHDVEDLLWREGHRTSCTHEQALRIVRPLEPV